MQYVACMNPTAGSFTITPRLQRHFATFAVQMPSTDIVRCAGGGRGGALEAGGLLRVGRPG